MTHDEKRIYLIKTLLNESEKYEGIDIPTDKTEQKRLLRSLFNVRMPRRISNEAFAIQDEYLSECVREKGIVELSELAPAERDIYLWQGDITTLRCDAIVNAANSGMLGCFYPCHGCIDNAIHTYSGIQLRLECARMMKLQGHGEPTGTAKLTSAYNLPSRYIIHTVGPIVRGHLTEKNCRDLSSCYSSVMKLADANNIKSVAFCCISTGEFGFPNDRAAEIAVQTIRQYKKETGSRTEVIFNVFKDNDRQLYENILKG